jgi:hypothetical protein
MEEGVDPQRGALKHRIMELIRSVDRNAGSAHPKEQENVTSGQELVIRLWAGCRSIFRAIYLLLERDLSEEARILSRTLLDDTARLHFLLRHKEDLELWEASFHLWSLSEALRLAEFEAGISLPGAPIRVAEIEKMIQSRLAAQQTQFCTAPPRFPRPSHILREINQGDLYLFFKVASQSVHTTLLALHSRAKEVGEGHHVVDLGGDFEVLVMVGLLSCEVFASATVAAVALLNWDTLPSVQAFRDVVVNEVRALRTDAQKLGIALGYEVEPEGDATESFDTTDNQTGLDAV